MLIVGVRTGRDVIVGDHTVVTVASIDRISQEVKLGFDSSFEVQRASNPETTMKAAKIRARSKRGIGKKMGAMEHKPVYMASEVKDGEPNMKAALTRSKASFPGCDITKLSDDTDISLSNHEFLVVRCATEADAKAMRTFATKVAQWPVLDEIEDPDTSIYLLIVRTLVTRDEGDVRYIDTLDI